MKYHLTMKELPDQDRPYEKCLQNGPGALSDSELISVIIRTGSTGEKSTDLAGRVLSTGPDGLLNLIYMSIDELMKIRGIGAVKAVQLKCAGELARRIASCTRSVNALLDSPNAVALHFMEQLRHEEKENLVLAMFDRKSMLIGDEVISIGTSNASLISPQEVFKTALHNKAEYIIMLHNHPSGVPDPSPEDIRVTERIRECGTLLGIPLLDHIIIGDNCYFSFREQDILTGKET